MPEVQKEELLGFIARAHRHTYAAPKEIRQKHRCDVPLLPGHKDYEYVEGIWRYRDSYAGKVWAPGSEVVLVNNEPIWRMSYQGKPVVNSEYSDDFFDNVGFPFLKKALMAFNDDVPFRGLDGFVEGDFKYTFSMDGDYQYFTAKEAIWHKGNKIFFQDVMGEQIK